MAADWVVLSDISEGSTVHRFEARTSSVRRYDLYAVFEQRLILGKKGKPPAYDERRVVAMNCYTGKWDDLFVGTFENPSDAKPTWKARTAFEDIDGGSWNQTDITQA